MNLKRKEVSEKEFYAYFKGKNFYTATDNVFDPPLKFFYLAETKERIAYIVMEWLGKDGKATSGTENYKYVIYTKEEGKEDEKLNNNPLD